MASVALSYSLVLLLDERGRFFFTDENNVLEGVIVV